ncbi:CHAT domain-containing protein [Nannocystis punicea]|uniref:CHAT domain-containing protein n=1 Tax=Nannocystis punicea TaxID=2995304 RepID=A0ABY7GRK4_9BACT|nr:CHAT domain-containing protein [Nannocystis poenicansa]WAS89597.1 CHAT domain-containing protein [Nannocystis poenicansa]
MSYAPGAPPPTPAATVTAAAAPEVIPLNCDEFTAGRTCGLRGDSTLELWIAAPPAEAPRVELDGVPLVAAWTAAGDGSKTELRPTPGLLGLHPPDASWRWELRITAAEAVPRELAEIENRSTIADIDEALLDLLQLLPALGGAARAEALALQGDIEFRRGDISAALESYELAFDASVAAHLLGRASDIAATAVFACAALVHDLPGARRWLSRHLTLVADLPKAELRHDYYGGLVAERLGDAGTALRLFRRHAQRVRTVGLTHELAATLSATGVLLARLGDATGADTAFTEALSLGDAIDRDERVVILHNAAWTSLEARLRGRNAPDPEPRFAEVAAAFAEDGPFPDRFQATDALMNLTYAAVLRGDVAAAEASLTRADAPGRRLDRWRLYLSARIDLLAGRHAQAGRRFDQLAVRARDESDRGLEWSAQVGAAEALIAQRRLTEALERYRLADALHRSDVGRLAVDAGRERFSAERDQAAQRLVALLLDLGRPDEAFCAARRARAHAFTDLAAVQRDPAALAAYRDDRAALDVAFESSWELPRREGEAERERIRQRRRDLDARLDAALRDDRTHKLQDSPNGHVHTDMSHETSCSALRPVAGGELLLVYYPLGRDHVGFARDADQLVFTRIDGDLPADLELRAERLLGAFDTAIERAERIAVAASGPLAAEAFHALSWRGAPLVAARPVAFTLDLPRAARPSRPLARVAQLVPPSNLAHAEEEAGAAADVFRGHGVGVDRLRGDEPDLTRRLAGVDLLHFVGHARGDGWSGALDLGGDRSFSVGDLLASSAPAVAVLSGCETGLLDPRAHGGGMSLAHALLLAGADVVIAADARVADDLASALIPATLTAIADGVAPVAALRAAQDRLRGTREDWSRFRAYVP